MTIWSLCLCHFSFYFYLWFLCVLIWMMYLLIYHTKNDECWLVLIQMISFYFSSLKFMTSHTYHKHLQSNYSRKHRFITPIQHLAIHPIVHLFKTWMAQNLARFQSQNTGETINYLHLLLAAIMQSATISQLLRNNETIPKAVHHHSGGSQHNWIHTVRVSSCPNRISIT